MSTDLDRNKESVQALYDLMFNKCRPREAIERYAGAEYRQHNPQVGDGKEAFIKLLRADGSRVSRQARRVHPCDCRR